VTARDVERGTIWKTETNEEGTYNLPRLPVGDYEVRVEVSGFQAAIHPPFNLVLNQTARVDFMLTIGQVSQTLEVTTATPLLQTETTQVGTVMQASAIANLPLETRNYNQLTLLVPGAVTIRTTTSLSITTSPSRPTWMRLASSTLSPAIRTRSSVTFWVA
jgi:hypothetical protein